VELNHLKDLLRSRDSGSPAASESRVEKDLSSFDHRRYENTVRAATGQGRFALSWLRAGMTAD